MGLAAGGRELLVGAWVVVTGAAVAGRLVVAGADVAEVAGGSTCATGSPTTTPPQADITMVSVPATARPAQ
jgi:hypothetical protein